MKKNEEDAVAKKTKAFFYRLHNERLPDGVSEQSLDEEINKREAEILAFEKKLFEGGKGEFTGILFF